MTDCFPEDSNVTRNTPSKDCYSIPYEWFDYENPDDETPRQRKVLIFWLNESHFVKTPLNSIKQFLGSLLPEPSSSNATLRATVLGPGRSDALRNLVTTAETPGATDTYRWLHCSSGLAEFNIISSTATVDDTDLLAGDHNKNRQGNTSPLTQLQQKISDNKLCSDNDRLTAVHLLRTIQSDDVLIKKLAAELIDKRGIDAEKDHVVVISEWDTYFGRSLPRSFTRHFCAQGCGETNVVRYSYQRGMDGSVAGERDTASKQQSSSQQKVSGRSPAIEETTLRRPVGTGQYDYLRRLAAEIQQKDYEWRLGSGYGVRAVVLLGSDVYDKLLILRALRPELPGALFATTDLDSHLLHPAEFSWTRNMIVASTFDLVLSPQVPMSTMPFRDSYQTSIYLATRLAFNKALQDEVVFDQQKIYKKIPPQLMEIGRQALVPLPDATVNKNTWNQLASNTFAPALSLGLFTIAVLGIFAFHQLRTKAGREVVITGALLLLFSALSILIAIKNNGGEPLAFLAGASIWPAEYIRLFSVLLSLVFIGAVIHILHRSWSELGARYFWQGSRVKDDGLTVEQIWLALKQHASHPIQTLKKLKCTHILPAIMVLVLIIIMRNLLPIKLPLFDKILLLIAVWGVLITFWWALIYGRINKNFHILSVNKWASRCVPSNKDAVEMWRRYGEYGAGDQRFMRTIAYILIYFAFASIVFAILGSPASPCRGDFACTIDKIILGFSVLSMLVLLFIVVDAARLCICWVDSMHKLELDWSNTRKMEYIQRLRLPDTHAVAWIKVHLIGERTDDVTRLIYFPVLIILLQMLARSTYFDNWDFPQALAIIIGLNFAIALGSVVRLNYVAQSARSDILRDLQDEKLAADRKEDVTYEPSTSERQELIHQLESLRIGAYLRVWDQPPVRATLMLLGGVALTYAEYLTVLL